MKKYNEKSVRNLGPRAWLSVVMAVGIGSLAGCGGAPDKEIGGNVVDATGSIELPTDTLLNLACEDVGIWEEQCVLDDDANPFRGITIEEFNLNEPDEEFNKFELEDGIPAGPSGAKARFYFWATALARRPLGENQYFTALALHELYTVSRDPLIREQAKKAYRSLWDNFFGTVVVFECCGEFFPFEREDTGFAVTLNEQVLERLVRAAEFPGPGDPDRFFYPDGFEPLIPDDPSTLGNPPDPGLLELETTDVITDWGFNYSCTGEGTAADPRLCFVEPNIFVSPLPI